MKFTWWQANATVPNHNPHTDYCCCCSLCHYHWSKAVLVLLCYWCSSVCARPQPGKTPLLYPVQSQPVPPHRWTWAQQVSDWEPLRRSPSPTPSRFYSWSHGLLPNRRHRLSVSQDPWSAGRTRWKPRGVFGYPGGDRYYQHQHQLHFLNNSLSLCNDGSSAGYYYRPARNHRSGNWLIFLEGGWYCFDDVTCNLRESNAFELFSSNAWPSNRALGGILSGDRNINPIYHDYHSVFIPYCSSDLWTGKMSTRRGRFYFHGSRILQAVVDELPWHTSNTVQRVIFVGSSAGGIGVMMNVDRLRRRLEQHLGHPVLVSGIIDSAWFIHIPAYRQAKCSNVFECPAEEGIYRGMRYWRARIPKSCRKRQPVGERWRCYLAPFMYGHLQTPVYIVQSLFDEAQLQMSKVPLLTGGPYEKWSYIQKLGNQVAQSLRRISGVFAPSCIDHEILTKNNWVHKAIGSVGLIDALLAWDRHLLRKWTRQKMAIWTVKNDQSTLHQPTNMHKAQYNNLWMNPRLARNSTLLFLSRLVSVLNRNSVQRQSKSPTNNKPDSSAFHVNPPTPFRVSSNQMPTSVNKLHGDVYSPPGREQPSALTMTRSGRLNGAKQYYDRSNLLNIYLPNPTHTNLLPAFSQAPMTYHVIDSCGLVPDSGSPATDLCPGYKAVNGTLSRRLVIRQAAQKTPSIQSPKTAELDNLIPQCNPTCGFLSNPYRLKLVDLLALYEVNTDLLAKILGLSTAELKSLDSEQQMRALFCGNHRKL